MTTSSEILAGVPPLKVVLAAGVEIPPDERRYLEDVARDLRTRVVRNVGMASRVVTELLVDRAPIVWPTLDDNARGRWRQSHRLNRWAAEMADDPSTLLAFDSSGVRP